MQLQQHQSELESLGIAVVVVTFESPVIAENYARATAFPWPILLDRSRELYHAYHMDRGGWWVIFGPSSWWGYLKLLLRGRKLRRPTDDVHQLGGDVLIDPKGTVCLHHVSRTPIDRPSVESLLEAARNRNQRHIAKSENCK